MIYEDEHGETDAGFLERLGATGDDEEGDN